MSNYPDNMNWDAWANANSDAELDPSVHKPCEVCGFEHDVDGYDCYVCDTVGAMAVNVFDELTARQYADHCFAAFNAAKLSSFEREQRRIAS